MKMWKRILCLTAASLCLLGLPGCWSKNELTEWGFAQAVAIDRNEQGRIVLVTHFYKPTGEGQTGESKSVSSYMNIRTEGSSLFDAVRDIPIHLGRKAQWSHLRIILIGEETAKQVALGDLLDYFVRDHEPRATISLAVTKGFARDYLDVKPLIEHTLGQQLREINRTVDRFVGKSFTSNLLELYIQMLSPSGIAYAPYLYKDEYKPVTTPLVGLRLLKHGKISTPVLSPEDTQNLLYLTNRFHRGVLPVPCGDASDLKEAFEIQKVSAAMKPTFQDGSLKVDFQIKLAGSAAELHCSDVKTPAKEEQFVRKVSQTLEKRLQKTVALLQKEKMDALGIGNLAARKKPQLWNMLKDDWDDRFAAIPIQVHVQARVLHTGMKTGAPFDKESRQVKED